MSKGQETSSCRRLWNPPWSLWWVRALWKGLFWGLLLGQALALLVRVARVFPSHSVDFAQYYFLAQWVNGGGSITNASWPRKVGIQWPEWVYIITPFLPYQPLLLPVMRVLARLPYVYAYLLWSGCALLLWWWLTARLARRMPLSSTCICLVFFAFPSLWFGMYWGNVDVYLAAGVLGAILLSHEGRAVWSGFLWGWLIAFKPFLFFGALPALRRWRWPFLAGLVGGGISALGVAWRAVGIQGLWFLLQHLPRYTRITTKWFLDGNASLTGWFSFWVGPETSLSRPLFLQVDSIQPFVLFLSLGLFLLTLWVWVNAASPLPWVEEGLWLTLALLLAPFSWSQYLLYLFGPVLALDVFLRQGNTRHTWVYAWHFLLLGFLSGFLWGSVDTTILARLHLRVVSLFAGTVSLSLWMFFWIVLYQARKKHRMGKGLFPGKGIARNLRKHWGHLKRRLFGALLFWSK